MRRRLLALTALAALALLLAACGDDDSDQTFDPGVEGDDDLPDQVVVFGPDDVETDVYGEEVTWRPGTDDVAAVEELLAEHLRAEADQGVEDLDTYVRQYTGVGEDEDLVSVNALCDDDLDWEDDLILVNDGGPCFWQATVDPTTGTVDPFTVNGAA